MQALSWLAAPRPYAMVSANTNGDANFAAAGLYWRVRLSPHWSLEPGLGLAVHDGELHNPFPRGDPRADAYGREHQILGARVLFRDTLAPTSGSDLRLL